MFVVSLRATKIACTSKHQSCLCYVFFLFFVFSLFSFFSFFSFFSPLSFSFAELPFMSPVKFFCPGNSIYRSLSSCSARPASRLKRLSEPLNNSSEQSSRSPLLPLLSFFFFSSFLSRITYRLLFRRKDRCIETVPRREEEKKKVANRVFACSRDENTRACVLYFFFLFHRMQIGSHVIHETRSNRKSGSTSRARAFSVTDVDRLSFDTVVP